MGVFVNIFLYSFLDPLHISLPSSTKIPSSHQKGEEDLGRCRGRDVA